MPAVSAVCAPRRIFIDLGVNWCNTILQYREHEPTRNASKLSKYAGWEVYGFEASPLIQPYVEDYIAWLDGRQLDAPVLCLPPTGSSKHLAQWAPLHGCPTSPMEQMRACMWQKLALNLLRFVRVRVSTAVPSLRHDYGQQASAAAHRLQCSARARGSPLCRLQLQPHRQTVGYLFGHRQGRQSGAVAIRT